MTYGYESFYELDTGGYIVHIDYDFHFHSVYLDFGYILKRPISKILFGVLIFMDILVENDL